MRKTTILVMMAALSACNGTRTGNPVNPGDDGSGKHGDMVSGGNGGTINTGSEGAIGNCDAKPSDLDSLDEKTKLGFSANDILAFSAGVHETRIRWGAGDFATFGPESGEHGLRIEITRASGKARFVSYEEGKSNGEESGGLGIALPYADCSQLGAIEIDVDVKIKSDGGALDESGKATLRATKASWATLRLNLKAEDIQGDLVLRESKPAGFVLNALDIALDFSPFGVRGGLQPTLTMASSGGDSMSGTSTGGAAAVGGGAGLIGDSDDCDDGGFVVALDDKLDDFDAQDAIDRVGTLKDVAFTWVGGTMAHATFAFEPDGTDACAVLDPSWLLESNDEGLLRVHGTLHVTTDDDRVDADWPVVLEGHGAKNGSLGDITLELQTPDLLDAMTLDVEAQYGITGIDSTGFDAVRLMFMVRIPAGGDAVNGMLVVNGIEHAMCPPPPKDPSMGVPGCRGDDITSLLSATFGTGDPSNPDPGSQPQGL